MIGFKNLADVTISPKSLKFERAQTHTSCLSRNESKQAASKFVQNDYPVANQKKNAVDAVINSLETTKLNKKYDEINPIPS